MSALQTRILWLAAAVVLGATTFAVLHWVREFPWQFALASAAGVTGLVFVVLLTAYRLRIQLRTLKEPWF